MTIGKSGRPPRFIGPKQLQDAEVLFKKSVESGEPDYRLVALAIGAEPVRPPVWAMLVCVRLAMSMERTSGDNTGRQDGVVLDEAIRVIARHEDSEDANHPQSHQGGENARREISVERALREAYLNIYGEEIGNNARRIRRIWDDEQKQTEFQGRYAVSLDNPRIKTTERINRVLLEFESDKMSGPLHGLSNPQRASFFQWMLDALAEGDRNFPIDGVS